MSSRKWLNCRLQDIQERLGKHRVSQPVISRLLPELDTPEIVRWNEKTGVSVTATIEIVHDSVTNLTDKEIWLEAMYLGTFGYPLGSLIDDAAANYLSSGADQTASTETWTTTGLTNPNKQKLSVTFTPQEKGTIRCVVKLAKASKTVNVDPKLNVTY